MSMNIQQQATEFQKQAQAAGVTGTMYLLSCPAEGWLRLQLKDINPQLMIQLIQGFEQTLAMGGRALNLTVKVKMREAGQK